MKNDQIPVEKNELIDVTFEDLTHDGAGVAKINGYPLFVKGGLPGEKGQVKVVQAKKNYGFGRLMGLTKESPDRVAPPCPIFHRCGGCQLQHLSYEGQLAQKQKQVEETLARIGGITDVPVHPVIGMDEPWRYRNKSQVPIGEQKGHVVAGFFAERSHEIVDMESCIIQHEENDHVVRLVKELARKYGVRGYDDKTHKGTLRHVVVRQGKHTKEMMVVLVTKGKELANKKNIIQELRERIPNVKSIVQNINPKRTNVIFGEKTEVLWGEEVIYDYIGDIKFAISARSFYQVNPDQTKVLYEKALEYAQLTGKETVIDAYCGIGTISLFLAKEAKHVYGVEVVPEAVSDAQRNARLNHVENATFVIGEAEGVMPWWQAQGIRADVIVVDPPRKGCDENLLKTMVLMKPERIVYVSCNPASLARDLKYLTENGFEVKEVQPVDMFPQTGHIENVVALELKN
ncbi:23S rRNA (uracil(1939)-C(5))-methyltransferase RlmD [Salipaludibacillus neizhouensis]|uniref:23S rRNA (Uracil(1939)-C(5))-methyltransferase RlmD n=1 Tax=Salipaludibacillus neizhouensis TaxID=885475 RepID=A0A3A9K9N1_9BACI|nr:23S rRNA (uracil(1939)-C(5))-methyltransferase RlmD [Salipaludibacillus neizhouensis]RKL67252.1 23S rRNA (uracil(1939)-C(5))-methyltransferase RlmD [Salipaludibacillus neizhouensis]